MDSERILAQPIQSQTKPSLNVKMRAETCAKGKSTSPSPLAIPGLTASLGSVTNP